MKTNTRIATEEVAKRYQFEHPWVIPIETSDGRPVGEPYIPKLGTTGYPVVSFRSRKRGICQRVQIHQAVLYQIHGDAVFASGVVCRHKNSIKTDFSQNNLVLGSPKNNYDDNTAATKQRLLLAAKAAAVARRSLSDNEVRAIRKLRISGVSYHKIAEQYGVCKTTIRFIMSGRTYADVGE